jgi:hypothetical protein
MDSRDGKHSRMVGEMVRKIYRKILDRKWKARNLRGEFKDKDQELRFYYGPCPKCSRPTIKFSSYYQ